MTQPTKVEQLQRDAKRLRREAAKARADAAQARTKSTSINRATWGVAIGVMIYGAVNVTLFVIDHDVFWAIAPLLSLMVDLGLCVALWAGPILAQYNRRSGWVNLLRVVTALMSLALNAAGPALHFTGRAWTPDWVGVGIHSCGPILLMVVAEAAAALQRTLAEIVAQLEATAVELEAKASNAERAAQAAQVAPVGAQAHWGSPLTGTTDERSVRPAAAQPERPALTGWTAERPALTAPLTTAGDTMREDTAVPAPAPERIAVTAGAAVEQHPVDAPSAAARPALHLVTPPTSPTTTTPHTSTTDDESAQVTGNETPDETPEETDPEARMRGHWDREVAAGRVPSGAELARVGLVSPATGKRRRAAWEIELPAHLQGGGTDAASA